MRVILTRHYKTVANAEGRILGWGDSPPHREWQADIDFIETQLREKIGGVDAVYSSDLRRARQTAKTYARLLGIAEVISVAELREINYGDLRTRKKSWVYDHYPQHKKDPDFVYPAGESFAQMQQRCVGFLASLVKAQPQTTVLVVSHAGIIRGLVSYFLGLEYSRNLIHQIPFRYIGDLSFANEACVGYAELGETSGFVQDGAIKIPFVMSDPGT